MFNSREKRTEDRRETLSRDESRKQGYQTMITPEDAAGKRRLRISYFKDESSYNVQPGTHILEQ